jgi:hypothetical protein
MAQIGQNRSKNTTPDYQAVTKKMQKKCRNIWSVQKKAVILHPLLRNKCVSIFSRSWALKFRFFHEGPNFFALCETKTN